VGTLFAVQGEAPETPTVEQPDLDPTDLEDGRTGPPHADPKELADRLMLARADMAANSVRLQEARDRIRQTRARWTTSRTLREASHESAYIRLLARFESQPVIEQAKGILMAESHCSADQAFEMLRKASQRENTPVREIAARIVKRVGPR
jgi:hypothetical protein